MSNISTAITEPQSSGLQDKPNNGDADAKMGNGNQLTKSVENTSTISGWEALAAQANKWGMQGDRATISVHSCTERSAVFVMRGTGVVTSMVEVTLMDISIHGISMLEAKIDMSLVSGAVLNVETTYVWATGANLYRLLYC